MKGQPELQGEVRRLQRAVQELSLLNELAMAIASVEDAESIMRTIIKRSLDAVGAEQASITLVDAEARTPAGTIVREWNREAGPSYHLDDSLLGRILHDGQPLLINHPRQDAQLAELPLAAGVRNLIAVPMRDASGIIGVLIAFNRIGTDGFSDEDRRMLTIIASQSAQVLHRTRLKELEEERRHLREELRMAERIQARLLPQEMPCIEGYEMAGATVPASEVGGDYFDFISLPDGRQAFVVGDVSGKGLPASLLTANLQATVRGQILQMDSPAAILERTSRHMHLSTPPDKFATLFQGILDPGSHTLSYANAGHEHPVLLRTNGTMLRLKTGGLPVGILDEFIYSEEQVTLGGGDVLVAHSDGVTDMLDPTGENFGEERLLNLIRENRDRDAADLVQRILGAVRDFAAGASPFDDVTVVVLRRLSS